MEAAIKKKWGNQKQKEKQGQGSKQGTKGKEDEVMRDAPITPPKKTKEKDEAPVTHPVTKIQLPYRLRKTLVGKSLPTQNRKATETADRTYVSMKAFVVHGFPCQTHK